jgi:hypothetical protein
MITTAVMTKKKRPVHYVNNKEFLDALIQYKIDCATSQRKWRTKTTNS